MATLSSTAEPSAPLRLLWLIDSLAVGGAEALVPTFVRAVDPRRLAVRVAFLKRPGPSPYEAELRALGVPCTHLGARNLRDRAALGRLVRIIQQERIDLVHAHLTDASIFGTLAGRRTGRPCIATLHVRRPHLPWPGRPALRHALMCFLLRCWAARIIAVSEAVRHDYVRKGHLPASKITVVHNGIDCDAWAPVPAQRENLLQELDPPPGSRLVLCVSVLREGKGLDVLLRALPDVLSRVPHTLLVVAGDGPLRDDLKVLAEQLGVTERVRWLGHRSDVAALLSAADVFVLPSLEDAFPTALLEAMSAGLPVVASRVGGIPEIIEDGQTGRLVSPGDSKELARVLVEGLEQPVTGTRLARAAQTRVRERFSSRVWVTALEAVYSQVMSGAV